MDLRERMTELGREPWPATDWALIERCLDPRWMHAWTHRRLLVAASRDRGACEQLVAKLDEMVQARPWGLKVGLAFNAVWAAVAPTMATEREREVALEMVALGVTVPIEVARLLWPDIDALCPGLVALELADAQTPEEVAAGPRFPGVPVEAGVYASNDACVALTEQARDVDLSRVGRVMPTWLALYEPDGWTRWTLRSIVIAAARAGHAPVLTALAGRAIRETWRDAMPDFLETLFGQIMATFGGTPPLELLAATAELCTHPPLRGIVEVAVRRALSSSPAAEPATLASLHLSAGDWATFDDDARAESSHRARVMALLPHGTVEWVVAATEYATSISRRDPHGAYRTIVEEVWPVVAARGDKAEMASTLGREAAALFMLKDYRGAEDLLRTRQLPILRELGDETGIGRCCSEIAQAQSFGRRYDEAMVTWRTESLPRLTQPADINDRVDVLSAMSIHLVLAGNVDARVAFERDELVPCLVSAGKLRRAVQTCLTAATSLHRRDNKAHVLPIADFIGQAAALISEHKLTFLEPDLKATVRAVGLAGRGGVN